MFKSGAKGASIISNSQENPGYDASKSAYFSPQFPNNFCKNIKIVQQMMMMMMMMIK
jgi:hypothetical protein